MSGKKCCICQKPLAPNQVVIRIIVEAVSRLEDDGNDPSYWNKVHDWNHLHMVHLTCVARELNKGRMEDTEYGYEMNELPLDEMVDELVVPDPVVTPLRLVQGGSA